MSNGIWQGDVSSGILFSVYIDDIMKKLRHNRIGCTIGGYFFGVFIFADNIILLSASRNGLQSMVNPVQNLQVVTTLALGLTLMSRSQKQSALSSMLQRPK